MNLNDYQIKARMTAIYPAPIIYPALKLNGEAGEVAEKVGKIIRDKESIFSQEDKREIAKELGDVLWYIANLAEDIGYELERIAELNLEKLSSRAERNKLQGSGDNR